MSLLRSAFLLIFILAKSIPVILPKSKTSGGLQDNNRVSVEIKTRIVAILRIAANPNLRELSFFENSIRFVNA